MSVHVIEAHSLASALVPIRLGLQVRYFTEATLLPIFGSVRRLIRTSVALVGVSALAMMIAVGGCGSSTATSDNAASSATTAATTPVNGVSRVMFGQAAPTNAAGQELYLQQVTIAPGSALSTHYHQGTQIASVRSGTLTLNIVSGAAEVTRADRSTESIVGPAVATLESGDSVVETPTLVHFGANNGTIPVVITAATLIAQGAPLATPQP